MRRRSFALLLLVALALSCGRERPTPALPAVADETTPQDGGTVVRHLESDVGTLNPVMATSRYDRYVDEYLFTPLVYYDQNLKCVPGLADKWSVSADGRDYTFMLSPKATFSDGTPVRASDVLFTLKKIADPQSEALQVAPNFERLDLQRTAVLDDHTIVIAFKEALASQMIRFTDLLVIPEHVYATGDFKTAFISRAVGSGPYRLVRRTPGQEVVLERRADYWRDKPHLQRVIFRVVVDATTAWNALKHGDIDETLISSDVWQNESRRPQMQKQFEFIRYYSLNYNYIAWNERNPLFADKRVRRALGMCLDLSSIINNIYHGTARAMNGPFTPDEWAYNPAVPVLPFDPDGAKKILTSVGWLDTNHDGVLDRGGKPFKFDLLVFAGSAAGLPLAQIYQEELKRIGIIVNVVTYEPSQMMDKVQSGNYDAAYLGWETDPDPDQFAIFHSSQVPPRGQNWVFYSSPEADRLIEEGRHELDFSKRVKIYQQLHQVLADDQPYTWTVQGSSKWAFNKSVRNVKEARGWGLFMWYPGEFDWWIPAGQRRHDAPPGKGQVR